MNFFNYKKKKNSFFSSSKNDKMQTEIREPVNFEGVLKGMMSLVIMCWVIIMFVRHFYDLVPFFGYVVIILVIGVVLVALADRFNQVRYSKECTSPFCGKPLKEEERKKRFCSKCFDALAKSYEQVKREEDSK
jgi:hypothetical protein